MFDQFLNHSKRIKEKFQNNANTYFHFHFRRHRVPQTIQTPVYRIVDQGKLSFGIETMMFPKMRNLESIS